MRVSDSFTPAIARAATLLRPLGFTKRGNRFNRRMPQDGIVHVLGFELGRHEGFEAPMSVGLRPSGYGTFTVNLGVFLPAASRDPAAGSGFVAEGQCTLTRRIGSLMDDASGGWWPVGSPDAVDVALGVIGDRALPWLDRFSSVDAVLRIHQLAPELLAPRPARWPVTLYLSRGRVAEAHAAFVDYLSAGIGPGQVPGLRDWLVERGLTDWEPDLESARVLEL